MNLNFNLILNGTKFFLQCPSYPFFKDFYGVTNATKDNRGSWNYEEKNNGMKVYSSHFLYWVLEGKKTTRSWFGNFSILPKWHFWTCAWNSKFFLAKIILLKHYENGNNNFFFVSWPRVRQNQDLCRKKYKKVIF